jgi:hypothetical protein
VTCVISRDELTCVIDAWDGMEKGWRGLVCFM